MKQLKCEMCGSTDFVKQDGMFVCQTCGTKYSVEEAQNLMTEEAPKTEGEFPMFSKPNMVAEIDALMKRGSLYLEDHDWDNAKKYFNSSLDVDPENAKAYIGMLLSELHIEREGDIIKSDVSFTENYNYQKALRFAKDPYKQTIEKYNLENVLYRAELLAANAKTEEEFSEAADLFESVGSYKNASDRVEILRKQADDAKIETTYQQACSLFSGAKSGDVKKAKTIFETIPEYKDSKSKIEECVTHIAELERSERKAHKKKMILIGAICCAVIVITTVALVSMTIANKKLANEIYNNFLGKTFDGEIEDDDGFKYAYYHNSLNEYMIYWLTTNECALTFLEDGTVSEKSVTDMTVLAYPKGISKPQGYHNEYEHTYSSFRIEVSLSGKVYIKIGASKYSVNVYRDNEPWAIVEYGLDRITLE